MGLRCLLGHDFGEPETEREREEEGSEVVVTVREVKTCKTCGETQVVSENKEIKSIEQLRETATGTADDGAHTDASAAGDAMGGPVEPDEDIDPADTVPGRAAEGGDRGLGDIIEDAESGDPAAEAEADDEMPTHPAEQSTPEADEDVDPAEEDAVILDDDEPEEAGREQWDEEATPEEVPGGTESADAAETAEDDAVIMDDDDPTTTPGADADTAPVEESDDDGHAPWPNHPDEDEGHKAGTPDGQPTDVDFSGGLAPQDESDEGTATREDAEVTRAEGSAAADRDDTVRNGAADESASADTSSQATQQNDSRQQGSNLNLEQSTREANLEYHCPECGLTRSVGNSSMRAGDICPDCRRGYISEREKQQ